MPNHETLPVDLSFSDDLMDFVEKVGMARESLHVAELLDSDPDVGIKI